ncbi:MAG: ABC transporter permease [Lentisphaeria bacterium]|nr:ABC transporter permease [Lentisphaeria bacterium]
MPTRRSRAGELLLTAPSLVWLIVLFAVPTLMVFAVALKPVDSYGGIGQGWTLQTVLNLRDPNYPAIVWRTLWMSAVATVVCVGLSVPTAYVMARAAPSRRQLLVLLVVVPFWTSFLVRIFAWKALLHPEGLIKRLLVLIGLVEPSVSLLYRPEAVLMVMVYTYLPFAILPVYAAAERFDWCLLEAAMDLGASRIRSFTSVFLPGISRGLATAVMMVFIPCLGSYVIPDVMGGTSAEMIGNKIAQRTFVDRNLPHASALSALLTLAVFLPLVVRWVTLWRGGASETMVRAREGAGEEML